MNNEITFHPLTRLYLPLIEQWLQEEHVKPFYKEDTSSQEAIVRKYESYIEGFTVVRGQKKPISSFIISYRDEPIGYAQYYDAHDFPVQGKELNSVLGNSQINEGGEVAGLDLFIGHPAWIGKGLGSRLIKQLLQEHIWKRFSSCIVDPHPDNKRAIRAFEKAGFRTIPATDPYLMLTSVTPAKPTFIRSSVYGVAILEGKILVVRQKQGVHQGKWDLPGGGIDPGESIEQALRREMVEEVGMQFSTLSPLANLTATTDHPTEYFRLHQVGLIYRIDHLQNIPAASAELHYSWMFKETLKTEPLTPFLTWVLSSMGEIK